MIFTITVQIPEKYHLPVNHRNILSLMINAECVQRFIIKTGSSLSRIFFKITFLQHDDVIRGNRILEGRFLSSVKESKTLLRILRIV